MKPPDSVPGQLTELSVYIDNEPKEASLIFIFFINFLFDDAFGKRLKCRQINVLLLNSSNHNCAHEKK